MQKSVTYAVGTAPMTAMSRDDGDDGDLPITRFLCNEKSSGFCLSRWG